MKHNASSSISNQNIDSRSITLDLEGSFEDTMPPIKQVPRQFQRLYHKLSPQIINYKRDTSLPL
jgi:hypothetical protein